MCKSYIEKFNFGILIEFITYFVKSMDAYSEYFFVMQSSYDSINRDSIYLHYLIVFRNQKVNCRLWVNIYDNKLNIYMKSNIMDFYRVINDISSNIIDLLKYRFLVKFYYFNDTHINVNYYRPLFIKALLYNGKSINFRRIIPNFNKDKR